jgi:hypothetical protein
MTYWKQIPIEVKPEKHDIYFVVRGNGEREIVRYNDRGWQCFDGYFTHYLVPVTDEEVEEKDKAILILKHLCLLKQHKDEHGKDEYYEKEQPKIWQRANDYLNSIK